MKVLVIQPKIGMGDMVIYLPYIHAISKKYQTPVSILVKENSRANQLLSDDKHIDEIVILDRSKNDTGTHDGISGFFKLLKELKKRQFDKVFIFNGSLRYLLISKLARIKNISHDGGCGQGHTPSGFFVGPVSKQGHPCGCGEHDDTQVEQGDDHGAFHDLDIEGEQQKVEGRKVGHAQQDASEQVSSLGHAVTELDLMCDTHKATQGERHGSKGHLHAWCIQTLVCGIPAKHQINASAAREHHEGHPPKPANGAGGGWGAFTRARRQVHRGKRK